MPVVLAQMSKWSISVLRQYEQMKEIFKRFGKGKGKLRGLKIPKGLF